jgi:putative ABC transport system permease protein
MTIRDLLEETYISISSNKVRSALTMLGIVIGIASVIAMVAIGQGAQGNIEASIQSAGANLLTVVPGTQRGVGQQVSAGRGSAQTLTMEDAEAIKTGVTDVKAVSPEVSRRYQVTTKGKNTNTSVTGAVADYAMAHNIEMETGSFISETDTKNLGRVAVLGSTARDDLFGEGASPIGETIRINNLQFRVIGIAKAKGGSGFNNPDDAVYVPLTSALKLLTGSQSVSTISVAAVSQQTMTSVQDQATALLLTRHKISDPASADFSVINQADIVAAASSVTGTLTALLASIAGISLLVGGIGIMNMMLTTVTERTREIGLRKAIGAHREDVSRQFLMESVALTFIGGLTGVALGMLISWGVGHFAGYASKVTLSSVLLAFGVSAGIGIVFGYYPATRAAKLNPIDALRYE